MIALPWPRGDGSSDDPAADVVDGRNYMIDMIDRVIGAATTEAGPAAPDRQLALDVCTAARTFLHRTGESSCPELHQALVRVPSDALRYLTAFDRVSTVLKDMLPHLSATRDDAAGPVRSTRSATSLVLDQLEVLVEVHRRMLQRLPAARTDGSLDTVERFDEELRALRFRAGQDLEGADDITFSGRLLAGADRERRAAGFLRSTASALVAFITLLSFLTLYGPLGHVDPVQDLTKLVVTLPLAALATFLGRESSRHRRAAERLWGIGLPLAHLPELIADFDPPDKRRITEDLMLRVPVPADGSQGEASADGPSVLGEVSGILASIPDIIRAARGE